ncbi:unnamed protein product [Bursaphelenchus okinawaensis]|uniref:F-box domain-containing protein n=1 Tax=Bursaphelenchus okinawaensis TaxID=465554 RepID=A0A811KMC7_9BILA|nr:unnamed protein product [Bursaphelenchus okinawaensis]CAG9106603.1 unnamed protein product [Bursaphelenchus okinawaensis]
MGASESRTSIPTLSTIPNEIQLQIFEHLNVNDVSNLAKTCSDLNSFVKAQQKFLARWTRHLDVDLNEKQCRIRRESSSNQVMCQCDLEDSEEFLNEVEVSTLTLTGPLSDDAALDRLISMMNSSKQFKIKSFRMKKVVIQSKRLCERLYQLLANGTCHAISLEECQLACGFSETQADKMGELCQFTVKDCAPLNGLNLLNKYLSKLAYDMRFSNKKSVPFYAEAPDLTVQEICHFIKSWIQISEVPFFQIYVTQCDSHFFNDFLSQCQRLNLAHHHLKFTSKAHPTAYIQCQYDQELSRFQIYPIVDVPAVGPTGYCNARYFRDF